MPTGSDIHLAFLCKEKLCASPKKEKKNGGGENLGLYVCMQRWVNNSKSTTS